MGPGSAGFPALRLRVGQSPGLTVPDRLVAQPHQSRSTGRPASLFRFARSPGLPGATRRPPMPSTRGKYRFPGLSRVPGEAPGWCSFPAVKVFLRPPRPPRKSLREFILSFSASTCSPQNYIGYPHIGAVFHGLMHNSSTGSLA